MTRALGMVVLMFGLVAAVMLVLVDGSARQMAERRAELARSGVAVVPSDVWVRTPSRPGQPSRVIGFRFELPSGEPVEGADSVAVEQAEALLAGGRPGVVYLPDRPQVNGLAALVGPEAAEGPRRGASFWLLVALAAGLTLGGLGLVLRPRPVR
mgnify:CR=1 FL=1